MSTTLRSILRTCLRLALLICALASPLVSQAIITSSDDRDNATPTAWWDYSGLTETQINDFVAANGARVVDIQLEAVAVPRRFTATFVSNTGAYAKAWWWYYDVDEATLNTLFTNLNARPISLKAYDIGGGQIRFAVAMISNTGADAKGWWWYYGLTPNDIAALTAQNNARLVQLNGYATPAGIRYAVVMIPNTGADQRGWWWYYNVSPATIGNLISANQARLVDMDLDPYTGNYNVIMNQCAANCPHWWWYYGTTAQQLNDNVAQNGARLIDLTSFPGCGSRCYSYVMINNSNDITTRVGEMLRDGTDGTKGLYLKQVNGPVLANLQEGRTFEPASTLKVALHIHALNQVQTGAATLNQNVTMYQPPTSGTCPGNTNIGTETLETALGEMMRHSDNTRTREVADAFGTANIVNYVQGLGMANTQINHVFGCGGPTANQTTLVDLGTLYEQVANNTLLNATNKATFYDLMPGRAQFLLEGSDWTGLWSTDIPNIIDAEAPIGMLEAVKQNFQNRMNLAYKAGNYKICGTTCATYVDHISIAGWASIPFCSANTMTSREYVFGLFINSSTSDATSAATFNATKTELLREQIRAGLASCSHANTPLDVDGNGFYDALTDGLLLIRYLFGISGNALTSNAIGDGASRMTPAATEGYMDTMRLLALDVDGDGREDALTDGLLMLRYLFGIRGSALITHAIGAGATRTTAAQIESFLASLLP